jgi:indolepyruvate ferredoxin oxidoreductase
VQSLDRLVEAARAGESLQGSSVANPVSRRGSRGGPTSFAAARRAVCARLTGENLAAAVAIAELPDMVRGYEQIKLDNVEKYRERLNVMLTEIGASAGTRCRVFR